MYNTLQMDIEIGKSKEAVSGTVSDIHFTINFQLEDNAEVPINIERMLTAAFSAPQFGKEVGISA